MNTTEREDNIGAAWFKTLFKTVMTPNVIQNEKENHESAN